MWPVRVRYNFKGVVSWCLLFRDNSVLALGALSGIEKRPLLGGFLKYYNYGNFNP